MAQQPESYEFWVDVTPRSILIAKAHLFLRRQIFEYLLSAVLIGVGLHQLTAGAIVMLGTGTRAFFVLLILAGASIGLSTLLQVRLVRRLGVDRLRLRLEDDGIEITDRNGNTTISPWSCVSDVLETGGVIYLYTKGIFRPLMLRRLILMLPAGDSIAERSQIADWLNTRRQ